MEKVKFTAEFIRRLTRFETALKHYRVTGEIGSLIPRLYSLASYCWCQSPFIKVCNKLKCHEND